MTVGLFAAIEKAVNSGQNRLKPSLVRGFGLDHPPYRAVDPNAETDNCGTLSAEPKYRVVLLGTVVCKIRVSEICVLQELCTQEQNQTS